MGEENLLGIVEGGIYLIFSREGVSWAHGSARGVIPDQVVILEKHLLSCLAAREALWLLKVGQVLVIGKDCDWRGSAGEVLVPFG